MERKHFIFENTRIHYLSSSGSNTAVMLIHGFGEDGSVWKHQLQSLKQKFRLIVPDIPGSGNSAFMTPDPGYNNALDQYADAFYQLLQHENINKCIIIGHSMGGYIALSLLFRHINTVVGIGFIHSSIFSDQEERKEMRKKGIAFIQKFSAHEFLKQSIPNLFGQSFLNEQPEEVESLIQKSRSFTSDALIQYYQAMLTRPDRTEFIKNYRKPVLFIIGEEDKSVSLQDSLKQCHIPSVSHTTILPGVGHMGMWEAKNQVSKSLEQYLNYIKDCCEL